MERLASGCAARSKGHTPCNKRAHRFSFSPAPCSPRPSFPSPTPPQPLRSLTSLCLSHACAHANATRGVRLKGAETRNRQRLDSTGCPANRPRNLAETQKNRLLSFSFPLRSFSRDRTRSLPPYLRRFASFPRLPRVSLSFRARLSKDLPSVEPSPARTTNENRPPFFFFSLPFSPHPDFSFFIRSSALPFFRSSRFLRSRRAVTRLSTFAFCTAELLCSSLSISARLLSPDRQPRRGRTRWIRAKTGQRYPLSEIFESEGAFSESLARPKRSEILLRPEKYHRRIEC